MIIEIREQNMHDIIISMISGDNAKSMDQRAHPTICNQTLFALHSEACEVWKICTFLFCFGSVALIRPENVYRIPTSTMPILRIQPGSRE